MESCARCGKTINKASHITCAKCGSTFCEQHMNTPECPNCGYKGNH